MEQVRNRLRHWLFEARGKKCRYCCLFCHYWHICQKDAYCSHGRPRDIVNLLNKIIVKYPDADSFTNEMFMAVELEYSKDFCNELRNEMSLYYSADYINSSFNILKLVRKSNFWKEEAIQVINKCENQLPGITDIDEVLKTLFKYGVLGNMKVQHNNGKNDIKYYFGYSQFQEKNSMS